MKSIITVVILFFATASFAQSTISGKVVEKENLLQEQTSILMVLTMALLQTKRTIFVFNYCNRKPVLVASFLVYETSKTTINVADFKIKQSFYREIAIH
jgi:hypothetical protein